MMMIDWRCQRSFEARPWPYEGIPWVPVLHSASCCFKHYHFRAYHHTSVRVKAILRYVLPTERFVYHDAKTPFYLRLRKPHFRHCTCIAR